MEIPFCCGRNMTPATSLGKFVEMRCRRCGDVVYLREHRTMPLN